ncbi:MAG TPA: hypothetical protein VGO90_04160, partial [Chthoniobacteraceae bacterium]|nr:hypothetical protein [Chthoniobacteraceae bacterium]
MTHLRSAIAARIRERLHGSPLMQRLWETAERASRSIRKRRAQSENANLLPLLIQVLAAFSKAHGEVLEE